MAKLRKLTSYDPDRLLRRRHRVGIAQHHEHRARLARRGDLTRRPEPKNRLGSKSPVSDHKGTPHHVHLAADTGLARRRPEPRSDNEPEARGGLPGRGSPTLPARAAAPSSRSIPRQRAQRPTPWTCGARPARRRRAMRASRYPSRTWPTSRAKRRKPGPSRWPMRRQPRPMRPWSLACGMPASSSSAAPT